MTPISRIIHDRYICIFERDIKVNIFVQKKHHYTNIPHAFLTTLYDNCSVFVMSEISLLPHSSAQTEGEDDGQQLDGGHHHHGPDDDVEILLYQHYQLVVAARVQVRVVHVGVLNAVWICWLYEDLVARENTARLRDL